MNSSQESSTKAEKSASSQPQQVHQQQQHSTSSSPQASTQRSGAAKTFGNKRRWAALGAIFVLLANALAFWFAQQQIAASDPEEPVRDPRVEFWQPREVNKWQRSSRRQKLNTVAITSDGQTAYAAGDSGTLLKSSDRGQSWENLVRFNKSPLTSIAITPDGNTAIASGHDNLIRMSSPAENVREYANVTNDASLSHVAVTANAKTALAVGDRGIFKSDDIGQNWRNVTDLGGLGGAELTSIAITPDGNTALAVGNQGIVLRSSDLGNTWQRKDGGGKEWLLSVAISTNGDIALAVGYGSSAFRSIDSGKSWETVNIGVPGGLDSVAMTPNGKTILVVGAGGTILKSTDLGQSWLSVASGTRERLLSVAIAIDTKTALAVGENGTVLKSSDAGQSWQTTALYKKSPGGWYFAFPAFTVLACVLAAAWPLRRNTSKAMVESLMNKGVTDRPIERADQDRLAFAPVVEALSQFLRHSATAPPLAIAINAAWGQGKSSFMNMLAGNLRQRGARPVHFNVWHHQHEEVLLAPLLQAVVSQAIPAWGHWAGWRFRARLWAQRRAAGGWAFWLGTAALLTLPAYALCLAWRTRDSNEFVPLAMVDQAIRDGYGLGVLLTNGPWLASAKTGGLGDVAGAALMALRAEPSSAAIVLLLVLFAAAWFMLLGYVLRPFPASPAILVASLQKRFSLSQAEAQTDFRQRFRKHFGQVARALQPQTMVVFIDDLDRCQPDKAAALLEAVNYLADAGPVFIVLGIARDIVEAQIAEAHKVLALEQAAMQRTRQVPAPPATRSLLVERFSKHRTSRVPTMATPKTTIDFDADRLRYAQKYLRKLVQLDVRLPQVNDTTSLQMLLDKMTGGTAAPVAATTAFWKQGAFWQRGLVTLILLAACVGAGWRASQTLADITNNREVVTKKLQQETLALRATVEDARLYASWLNDQATTKSDVAKGVAPKSTSNAKVTATMTQSAWPLPYKAKADMVQAVVRDLDAGLVLLEREALEGQRTSFAAVKLKVFDRSYAVFKSYEGTAQLDGRQWVEIKKGLLPAVAPTKEGTSTVTLSATALGGAKSGANLSVNIDPEPLRTPWELLFLSCMAPLLVLWLALFKSKNDFTQKPTPEYEKAVEVWQQELLRHPATASPRELKRFMNLSRYVVARLQTLSPKQNAPLLISETCIVELTAKWLGKIDNMPAKDLRAMLQKNGAKPEEVDLFLGVVGDLSG